MTLTSNVLDTSAAPITVTQTNDTNNVANPAGLKQDSASLKNYPKIASKLKQEIAEKIDLQSAKCTDLNTSLRNPIALAVYGNESYIFSPESYLACQEFENSAKLIMTPENHRILYNYFNYRKEVKDNLGKLYSNMTFEDFILRLMHKRYKRVYLSGSAIEPRDDKQIFNLADAKMSGYEFLNMIGTKQDKTEIYKEYLTLEEMMLSPLVLPQAVSVVIGTGSRGSEYDWNIQQEFQQSTSAAIYSYPAAAEFRRGDTAHYDLFFIARPLNNWSQPQAEILQNIKNNAPILHAAKMLYGDEFAFTAEANSANFIPLGGTSYAIHKRAYIIRTKNTLKQVLLAADKEAAEKGLGTIFQLKGLGLGAFAFDSDAAKKILEKLYLEALYETLNEINLFHITGINLVNLPTTFHPSNSLFMKSECIIKNIQVTRSNMDPLSTRTPLDICGTVYCGAAGSLVGNDANIGSARSSSDDPATHYTLLNPYVLDPAKNPALQNKKCIYIANDDSKDLTPLPQYQSKLPIQNILIPQQQIEKTNKSYKEIINDIKDMDDNKKIGELFTSLNNSSNVHKQRRQFRSGFFYFFRTHETTKTWANIVNAMKTRLMLNALNSDDPSQALAEIFNNEQTRDLVNTRRYYNWCKAITNTNYTISEILTCDNDEERDSLIIDAVRTYRDRESKLWPASKMFSSKLKK